MYSIVIPAFNEEKRIQKALEDYSSFLAKTKKDYEIIVVSDGSIDNTPKIVSEISKNNKRIKLIKQKRMGKGKAVVEGLRRCSGNLVGFMDADEPITPEEYVKLFEFLKSYDCVIASRRTKDSIISIKQPLRRRIASKTFNVIVNTLFNLDVKDTQCGAKVFRKEAAKGVLNNMKLYGFEFDVELLWRLKKKGCRIFEAPVIWKHGEYSKFQLKYGPRMLINIIKLRIGLI